MKAKKVIFLDIDGVINIPNYEKFDEQCMTRLMNIIGATGAKIVISSSWRCGSAEATATSLRSGGIYEGILSHVIGETCRAYHQTREGSNLAVCRGNEIKTWVDRNLVYPWHANPEMYSMYRLNNEDGSFKMMRSNKAGKDFSYIILDDDRDMLLEQKDFFINTDSIKGLSDHDVANAISILNKVA